MQTITFPSGTKLSVDEANRVAVSSDWPARHHPDLFYVDDYDGVMLTDDLDALQSAQELGFEFSDGILQVGVMH